MQKNILSLTVDVTIVKRGLPEYGEPQDIYTDQITVEGGQDKDFLGDLRQSVSALMRRGWGVSAVEVSEIQVCGLAGLWLPVDKFFEVGEYVAVPWDQDPEAISLPALDDLLEWFRDWCQLTQDQQDFLAAVCLSRGDLYYYSDVESERIPDDLLDQLPVQYIDWVALPAGEQFPIYSDWYWLDHVPSDSVAARYLRSKLFPAGVVNG